MKLHAWVKRVCYALLLAIVVSAGSIVTIRNKARWILYFQDLPSAVDQASEKYGVPRELLLAMAYAEARFKLLDEFPRLAWIRVIPWRPARAVSSLYSEEVGKSTARIHRDPTLSLGSVAHGLKSRFFPGDDPKILENWRRPLVEWHGAVFHLSGEFYADHILQLLDDGFSGTDERGRSIAVRGRGGLKILSREPASVIRPSDLVGPSTLPYFQGSSLASPQVPVAPRKITHIVIHSTENSFSTIVDFFLRPTTKVGSHYLIRAHDGFAIQMNDERRVVYHDACFNDTTIGIEHEGYSKFGEVWFNDALYRSSAKLVREIAQRHGVPLTREFILGHGEAPDCSDHTDPGPKWDWEKYMSYVQQG